MRSIVAAARAVLPALVLAFALAPAARAQGLDTSRLPLCWKVTSTYQADDVHVQAFATRFGAKLDAVYNYKIDAAGVPLQINIVNCPTTEQAQKVYAFFMTAQNATTDKYVRDRSRVYEFLCDNVNVRAKARDVVGVEPRVRTWRVRVEVAPLDRGDDSHWNDLFNALMRHAKNPNDDDATMDVLDLGAKFQFDSDLDVRMESPPWGAPTYHFKPAPTATHRKGDLLRVTFRDLPHTVDVPRLELDATVPVQGFTPYKPAEAVDTYDLTRATDPWPMAHAQVSKVFQDSSLEWDPSWTTVHKIAAIQCWVYRKIEYRGEEVGSRYGVPKTLEQRYGHCWDKSDAFIAICRRAKIPARQVFGWLGRENVGHVWAEAYDEQQGWIAVDATCSWLGVSDDYIPLVISETGYPGFVYASMPRITEVSP